MVEAEQQLAGGEGDALVEVSGALESHCDNHGSSLL